MFHLHVTPELIALVVLAVTCIGLLLWPQRPLHYLVRVRRRPDEGAFTNDDYRAYFGFLRNIRRRQVLMQKAAE